MALPPGMLQYQYEPAPGLKTTVTKPDPNYAMPAPGYVREDPQALAGRTNQFMTGQAVAPYAANLPNYQNLVNQRSAVVGQQMQGQLPQDVINQILQQGAERGIATGSPGGAGSNAAFLRALGLNSLSMQQSGMQNFSKGFEDTPVPQLMNPSSLYVPERAAFQEYQAAEGRNPFASGASPGPTSKAPATIPPFWQTKIDQAKAKALAAGRPISEYTRGIPAEYRAFI